MKQFKIYVETLKALGGNADGKRRLHGVASSTVKDRHGDVITLGAMKKMEQAATGMTIFFNHDYTVPESVAGTVEKAEIRQHPSDPDIYDLVYDIVMNESNPRAINSWESMEEGTKLGLSIGARIPTGGATKDADGVFTITDIELLETSIVGVPASPRSWVDYAVKSLRADMIEKATTIGAIGVDPEEAAGEESDDDDVAKTSPMELATADEPAVEVVTEDPTTAGEDEPPVNEEAEPESEPTEDVTFDSDEVATPQDAPEPESTPENGDVLQSDEEVITLAALLSSADSLKSAHAIIAQLDRESVAAKAAQREAEEERDKVVLLTQKTMDDTSSLLERLAKTSKGRQTSPVVTETRTRYEGLKSVYTDDVMALLTKEH